MEPPVTVLTAESLMTQASFVRGVARALVPDDGRLEDVVQ